MQSQGQNNSCRSNVLVGFAEEKIEHFAKLKQKEEKDTLEREKQVCLENRNNKNAQQRKCQKTIIQQENSNVLQNDADGIQDTTTCMYCEIQ